MKTRVLMVLVGMFIVASQAFAQQKTVSGKVTDEAGLPLAGVSVIIKGTNARAVTNDAGNYSIAATPGQILQFRFIGTQLAERPVGADNSISVQLRRSAINLNAVVVTALGQSTTAREIGSAQQTVTG